MSDKSSQHEKHFLQVHDNRTWRQYRIPIENNAVKASDLAQMTSTLTNRTGRHPLYEGDKLRVFDPGFQHTAVMHSSVTFANGEAGTLEFKGFDVEELATRHDFDEVIFLMLWDRFPSDSEKQDFHKAFAWECQTTPKVVSDVIKSFPPSAPFVFMLVAGLAAHVGSNPSTVPSILGDTIYHKDEQQIDRALTRVLGAYVSVMSIVHCHRVGSNPRAALPDCSFVTNMLRMMDFCDLNTGLPDPDVVKLIEEAFIYGVDHELANSAAALLHAASTMADPISCLINAINSGFGVLHFGAAQSGYKLMQSIATPDSVPLALAKVKEGKLRLMGVGHRVYKTKDPRVEPTKRVLEKLKEKGFEDPLIAVAFEIERLVEHDEFFLSRRLRVNIDLFWMFLYTAIGVPLESILPIFLAGRVVGLLAHWRESMTQPIKLWRPQQIYVRKDRKSAKEELAIKSKL